MYSYIRKFDDFSYEIAPKNPPYKSNITIYEGDEISITLRGIHLNDVRDPFNFDTFDSFQASFKPFHESSKTFSADSTNFILGQSDAAIQYDIDEGNPANTTYDELHFIDDDYSILAEYDWNELLSDIQGKVNDSIYTLIKFNVTIENQVTI